jgi:hypothetical protein
MRTWIQFGVVVVCVTLAVSVGVAWHMARLDAVRLQVELKASQAALAEAGSRQEQRDASLKQVLASIEKQKVAVRTPQEVVSALKDVLPLPAPLIVEPEHVDGSGPEGSLVAGKSRKSADASSSQIRLPAEDLKPLYDFSLDCKACKAQLAAAQADLKDERVKTAVVGRERDDALRVAKGGSVLRRVARAAKWFAIGAAMGAAAAKLSR